MLTNYYIFDAAAKRQARYVPAKHASKKCASDECKQEMCQTLGWCEPSNSGIEQGREVEIFICGGPANSACNFQKPLYCLGMNAPPDLEGMKILIEFGEDDGFTIQSKPSDDAMLLAALKLALFAIETKVDNVRNLH